MKTSKTIFIFLVMITTTSLMGSLVFAADDKNYRDESQEIFSPGYINAAKYQTERIIKQNLPAKKSILGKLIQYIQNKNEDDISDKVKENNALAPKLQMKMSGTNNTSINAVNTAIVGELENIKIGSGVQETDSSGRVIAEVIDGQRYVYAGFDDIGQRDIQEAIDIANSGDKVILKEGYYDYYHQNGKDIMLKYGVSIYGGYGETGVRDIVGTPTTIFGKIVAGNYEWRNKKYAGDVKALIQIDGLTMDYMGISIVKSRNVKISNINFNNSFIAVMNINNINLSLENNDFNKYALVMYGTKEMMNITSKNNNFYGKYIWYATNGNQPITIESSGDYYAWDHNHDNVSYSINNVRIENEVAGANQRIPTPAITTPSIFTMNMHTPYNTNYDSPTYENIYVGLRKARSQDDKNTGSVLKNILINKDSAGAEGWTGKLAKAELEGRSLERSALSIPIGQAEKQDINTAATLVGIIKNPTGDQKYILDVIRSLLNQTEKITEDSADDLNSEELKNAENNLLQVVENLLLSQSMPGLLKEGDVASINAIFSYLDTHKKQLIYEYEKATKPYYDNVVKDLLKNMAILQLNNILTSDMSKNDLDRLPTSELDKILDKIRKQKNKAFQEEYILQQEIKYRKMYLDPNQEKLKNEMKQMLMEFTRRINNTLTDAESRNK